MVPPGRVSRLGNTEYLYFTHERVRYDVAVRRCFEGNATLLIIKHNETQQHIMKHMPQELNCVRSFFYMGLFRQSDGWFWPDNTPFFPNNSFQHWRRSDDADDCRNEPNGYRGCMSQPGLANATQIQGCRGRLATRLSGNLGDWYDKNQFTSEWFYICQRQFCKYFNTQR